MKKRIVTLLMSIVVFATMFAFPASAATKYQGYALYRDKQVPTNYHAGLIDEDSGSKCIIHHPGTSGSVVSWISWNGFNVATFHGRRQPLSGISNAGRDNVRYTARNLVTHKIKYISTRQLETSASVLNYQTWIYPGDITAMRCDGVVEYSYEWHGYKILGGSYWDISKADWKNYNAHYTDVASPKKQFNAMKAT